MGQIDWSWLICVGGFSILSRMFSYRRDALSLISTLREWRREREPNKHDFIIIRPLRSRKYIEVYNHCEANTFCDKTVNKLNWTRVNYEKYIMYLLAIVVVVINMENYFEYPTGIMTPYAHVQPHNNHFYRSHSLCMWPWWRVLSTRHLSVPVPRILRTGIENEKHWACLLDSKSPPTLCRP